LKKIKEKTIVLPIFHHTVISPLFTLPACHLSLKRSLKGSSRLLIYGKGVKRHVPSLTMKAGNSSQALSSGSSPETLSLSSLICSFEFRKTEAQSSGWISSVRSQISASVCPAICPTINGYKKK